MASNLIQQAMAQQPTANSEEKDLRQTMQQYIRQMSGEIKKHSRQ